MTEQFVAVSGLLSARVPFFCGIILLDGVVIETAPLLKYMIGWDTEEVREHVTKKGWKAKILHEGRAPGEPGYQPPGPRAKEAPRSPAPSKEAPRGEAE